MSLPGLHALRYTDARWGQRSRPPSSSAVLIHFRDHGPVHTHGVGDRPLGFTGGGAVEYVRHQLDGLGSAGGLGHHRGEIVHGGGWAIVHVDRVGDWVIHHLTHWVIDHS